MLNKNSPLLYGYGIRLRPVTVDDADFILELRNMPHVKGKMGSLNITLEQEKTWLSRNINDPCDYFFIIESSSFVKLGTIGAYDIDFNALSADAGRFVAIPGSFSALSACILLQDFCFYTLALVKLNICVVASNTQVLSFNRKLGYQVISKNQQKRKPVSSIADMDYLELTKTRWLEVRQDLIAIAKTVALTSTT